ncbi:MAG TPA: YigZ family protein [Cryomorphaceae bacterium]|nr:YigZ family protein [Cryomorphaceae bacterium]
MYKVKGSKHFGYAFHVKNEKDIEAALEEVAKEHHSARHVAYAWRLGAEMDRYRANDDGEPSNSAGKPILGQIEKYELTNVLIAVVRYFGGTKLGVGGLIDAYRTAAEMAIEDSTVIERQLMANFRLHFGYERMSEVMLALRTHDWEESNQDFKATCTIDVALLPEKKDEVAQSFQAFSDIRIEYLGIS